MSLGVGQGQNLGLHDICHLCVLLNPSSVLFVFHKPILLVFSHITCTLYFIHEYILHSFISGKRKNCCPNISAFLHGKKKHFDQPVPLYTVRILETRMKTLAAFRKMHLILHQEFRTQKYKKLLYNLLSHYYCPLLWLKNCSISSLF